MSFEIARRVLRHFTSSDDVRALIGKQAHPSAPSSGASGVSAEVAQRIESYFTEQSKLATGLMREILGDAKLVANAAAAMDDGIVSIARMGHKELQQRIPTVDQGAHSSASWNMVMRHAGAALHGPARADEGARLLNARAPHKVELRF